MITPNQQYVYNKILDNFLEKGYYRMGRNFLTQNSIWYNNANYNVYWLRYNLVNYTKLKQHKTILKKAPQFIIEQQSLHITPTLNELYVQYANTMTFDTSISLEHYLYSYEPYYNIKPVVFNSKLLTISDHHKIVAAGIYDKGFNAMAGIINFYDPNYKKYSLGKMLVLAKLHLAIKSGMQYYYPGYIVPGIANFDYKTFVGHSCIEVWDINTQKWVLYNSFFGVKH
jgi:arginyl-tRNA--protein-N-Asp/Glu arginylyltransferase